MTHRAVVRLGKHKPYANLANALCYLWRSDREVNARGLEYISAT